MRVSLEKLVRNILATSSAVAGRPQMCLALAGVPAATHSTMRTQSHLCAGPVLALTAGPLTMSVLSPI